MPGLADPGPSGIASPNPAALVQPLQVQGGPDAVRAMVEAFRQGQISAEDIIQTASGAPQAKRKAEVEMAKSQASPEAIEARRQTLLAAAASAKNEADNAALAGETQRSKLKHENVVAKLGSRGSEIEAKFLAVGRLLPMMEDPAFPGAQIPDMAAIKEMLPQIEAYLIYLKNQKEQDAAWRPEKITIQQNGQSVIADGWVNDTIKDETMRTSATRPISSVAAFDNWRKSQAPGSAVVSPAQPQAVSRPAAETLVTPIQIGEPAGTSTKAPTQEEAIKLQQSIERATGQNLGTQPVVTPTTPGLVEPAAGSSLTGARALLANTPYENWRITAANAASPESSKQGLDVSGQLVETEAVLKQIKEAKKLAVSGRVGPLMGSGLGQALFRVGSALGISDKAYNDQRTLARLVNTKVLEQAKNMKGNLSDRDVRFLEASVAKLSDLPETWQNFLDLWERTTQKHLEVLRGAAPPGSSALKPMEVEQASAGGGAPLQTRPIAGGVIMEEYAPGQWRVAPAQSK